MRKIYVKKISAIALAAVCASALPLSACKSQAEAGPPPPDPGESIVVSAFSQEYQDFEAAIDIAFSKDFATRLAFLGDDPATGFRTAGSPAEAEAAALAEAAMRRAGLQNVTRERASADSWVFKGASLLFENRKGERNRIALGGYPVNLVASGQALTLVDAGGGRAADYEELDVQGKLVLLRGDGGDADGNAGFQAVQAKHRGAKAVLLCAEAGAGTGDKLSSRGFGAPSDAPAFAISEADYDLLKTALKRAENGELPVTFSADSVVAGGAQTENIWGEIPGKSAETVYLLANCDGFYHAVFEGATGVSAMLGIAKALCDSGFLPNKTLRFVACGAGEWGAANTPFAWGTGAWRQLSQLHPEWAEQAFAVLNLDALYPLKNTLALGMTATDEIYDFAERSMNQFIETGMYGFTPYSSENPSGILTEDILWNLFGIPAVAARPGEKDKFYSSYRHSSLDTIEALGFDDEAYRFGQLLFGKLILDLDETPLRPLNLERSVRAVLFSLEPRPITNARLTEALTEAAEAAATLAADTEAVNVKYLGSDDEARASIEAAAVEPNRNLYALNRMMRDAFARFDW
ncbi:MAG: M28 family peptidase, partial [Clostridiales Family XIII bacterium]|nr:M28 family peptidase [Clostridiales Family XIII bacterium]